ncbi:MAG: nitroreductase family deazaflavin-dependent oxidoreductase, partial [Chloroflexi bacterium]|nr:nitroreductase family deazaflavin-dependent oxidoreductase [Chloroflexota bacterium]
MPTNRAVIKLFSAAHALSYRLTGGRIGRDIAGGPVLLLTTSGRKSGKRRTAPLPYL